MEEKFSLKDHLFNEPKVVYLANIIAEVYPNFKKNDFQRAILVAFPNLELKERIVHIRICLKNYLPAEYREAVAIILKALPPALDENLTDNDFGDFIIAPFNDFVAHYGCNADNLAFSLAAIKEITKRFSAEDAIRYFINAFPEATLESLNEWAKDSNYHVRRLCSEGTRPKLPWAQKINISPETALPILDQLYKDKTRYVTRSVANHLNDIAKIKPDLVLDTLAKWKKSQQQHENEMNFIIKHALRTLIKNGHPEALAMLGYGDSSQLSIHSLQYDEKVAIGESLHFSFEVIAETDKTLMIDYIVNFQNKQGQLSNKKVFKLQTVSISAEQSMKIVKRHPFRANMTTRQLYAGVHRVDIQVNGTILSSFTFDLVM